MEVKYNKLIRITIEDGGIFFNKDNVESIFTADQYQKSQYVPDHISQRLKRGDEIPDEERFYNFYTFRNTVSGIDTMYINRGGMQMTILDFKDDSYLDVIRKFLEREPEWLNTLHKITCECLENYVARTYEELKEYGAHYLPDKMKDYESSVKNKTTGEIGDCIYDFTKEMCRGKASFFNMDGCLSVRNTVTVESESVKGFIKTVDEAIDMVIAARNLSEKIMSGEPIEDNDDRKSETFNEIVM